MELKRKNVMVVEDDPIIRNNLLEFFRLHDMVATGYKNGLDALTDFSKCNPDLIICDVMMPEMDGLTFLRELNKKHPLHKAIFIFLTAKNSIEDLRLGMNLGADDYITKPFDLKELLNVIKRRFEKQQQRNAGIEKTIQDIKNKLHPTPYQEFNNCLTGIISTSHLLLDEQFKALDLETRMFLEIINTNGVRLHKALNNYLFYQQILKNGLEAMPLITSIDELSKSAKDIAKQRNRIKDLNLTLIGNQLFIDQYHVSKIIEELVDNACKFSASGSMINLKLSTFADKLKIELHYEGGNFTKYQFKQVEAFKQFSSQKNNEGLGLGLYLCLKLTEALKGEFNFEHQENGLISYTLMF